MKGDVLHKETTEGVPSSNAWHGESSVKPGSADGVVQEHWESVSAVEERLRETWPPPES